MLYETEVKSLCLVLAKTNYILWADLSFLRQGSFKRG